MLAARGPVLVALGAAILAAAGASYGQVAVMPSTSNLDAEVRASVDRAVRASLGRSGRTVIPEGDVSAALAARPTPPTSAEEFAVIGAGLGAGTVLIASAVSAGDDVVVLVQAVTVGGGQAATVSRTCSRAQVPAAVEQMVAGLLSMTRGPVRPARAPIPPPVYGAPPPPRPDAERTQRPIRTARGSERRLIGTIFGMDVGLQAGMYGIFALSCDASASCGLDHAFLPMALAYAAVTPLVDSLAGWGLSLRSPGYDSDFVAMAIGSYSGAALALAAALLYWYNSSDAVGAAFTVVIFPIVLPPAGAAIGYAAGRRPKADALAAGAGGVEMGLPLPAIMRSMDGSGEIVPGVSAWRMAF
jgi:hypothetical protein